MEFTGTIISGDFEDNTMTFEIEGQMILKAGEYKISSIEEEAKLVSADSDYLEALIAIRDSLSSRVTITEKRAWFLAVKAIDKSLK